MWVALTFLLAVALIFLEFFIPGGVLGALGALALLTSMGLGFYFYSAGTGLAIVCGELFGAGVLLVGLMKAFPHTRIGRRMILQTELDTASGYVGSSASLEALVGQHGTAASDLRPAGIVRIQGSRVDAVADGVYVDSGQEIEVMEVDGNRVVVRPAGRGAGTPETETTA